MATGSEQNADRPAVIVSNDLGNRHAPIVELVYLTTRKKASLPTHVYIGSAEKPSIALCEQIVTVCKSRLQRHIGSVTAEEMHNIEKALTKSLGIHRTGGNDMQITLATPFGEMKFDMPPERATDLIQRAFQYAAGQETAAPKVAQEAPPVAQEPPKAPQAKGRPQSRVERMFGDFKASKEAEPKKPEPQREPEAYKGFLIIRCEQCGEIRAFCAKTPITRNTCKCGHTTELHGLKPFHLKCKCGSTFNYRTNVTDSKFEWPCLNCGSPVDLELNRRGDTYVTISD